MSWSAYLQMDLGRMVFADLARGRALPDTKVMLLTWPSTLKGKVLGKRLFAQVSVRMARCLALCQFFGVWPA